VAVASYTTTDPDLWGHVRFGLDMLRDVRIPHADVYSFTSDRIWINHEWLAEVVMAGAFRLGGDPALILVKLAAIGGMLLLLDSTLRRNSVDAAIVRDAAAAVAILLTIEQTRHVRPQLFSIVCFAALMWCLNAHRRGSHRSLLLLPPLFAVWANLHGGWLVGGGVLALWTVAIAATGDRGQALWWTMAGALSLCATLLTPYGVHLWTFLRETVAFSRADIVEWQPTYALGWDAWIRWSLTLALAMLGLVLAGRGDRRPERIVCLLALAIASFMVVRLQSFFAVAMLFLVGSDIARACQRGRVAGSNSPRKTIAIGLTAVSGAVAAMSLIVTNVTELRVDPRMTPAPGAAAFLSTQPRAGRVLVWFDWGEYAIWHLAPRMRVSIDGRRETAYSAGLQDRHLRFYFDAPGGSTLPADIAADYVWIPRTLPAVRRLEADGWRRLYEDGQSVIFGRAEGTPHATVALVATTAARVFPGP
jgi:hypothetical protein